MADIYDWSTTAADNDDADSTINWLEGQLPGTVNGSARAMMKRVKELLNDISYSATVGGTADAITVTSAIAALADNKIIGFKAASSNTGAATLAVNGLTAKAIRKISGGTDVALSAGDIAAAQRYSLVYDAAANSSAGAWIIVGSASVAAATTTQFLTGTSTTVFNTPDAAAALWEAGADNTGGATITMGEGGYFNLITSTTTITAFAFSTDKAGRTARVRFDTVRAITHNGTSLILPGGVSIPATAVGDIAQLRSLGSGNFKMEWYEPAGAPAIAGPHVILEDQKASGTDGGTFTSGADQTRVLNTEVYDPYGLCSLSSNQFTLPAGTYFIAWSCPAAGSVSKHQSMLYDETGTAILSRGSVEGTSSAANITSRSTGSYVVTKAASNAFSIKHRGTTTQATSGFGVSGSFGTEVYTRVEITKLA